GGTTVAQNDQDLAAEYSLSSFDRRHQVVGDLSFELPFGPNKRWLHDGGKLGTLFGGWRGAANYTFQSGTPFTPRVTNHSADAAPGVHGPFRADYNAQPTSISAPPVQLFSNTAAFSIPAPGTFGDASRNLIIGPGSQLLNAQFSRDIRMKSTRTLTLAVNATNLINEVNFATIDTIVNSPTFGHVISVRPMRSVQLNLRFRF